MTSPAPPRIDVRALTKRYGRVAAVEGVSLQIAAGSVHALVGANGAGKSTLGKLIAGAIAVDQGEILFDGEPVVFASPRDALDRGVALIAQELALAPALSVMANIFLGDEPRRGPFIDARTMRKAYAGLVERSGFALPRDALVGSLSIADRQKVEILRAVNRNARVIVMDEPTSSLTRDETSRLQKVIGDLRRGGTTVVYVSHFLDEVLELADEVTILRNGRLIRTTPAAQETAASLVTGMLGHSAAADYPTRTPVPDAAPVVLDVRGLSRSGALEDASLTVRAGEIVGLAGLVGSGRSELARAIFGADSVDAGTVALDGSVLDGLDASSSFERGIALLPESRKEQGLLMDQSVAANTTLPHLADAGAGLARFGWLARGSERDSVRALLGDLSVKPESPDALVRTMSGGNQQKVLFAKCLFRNPRVLILDEPTRGVDVGARRAIHDLIAASAAGGVAIVLISSDLEEVVGLAHRVLVMRRGALVVDLGADPSIDVVLETAFGVPQEDQATS